MSRAPAPPLGMARVQGRSMLPTLREGDRLLVSYRRRPRRGDVVVARLRDATIVCKRAAGHRGAAWWLLSDNADEGRGDSRAWGAVPDDDVLAVALARLWPRPRWLRRSAGVDADGA